jgi:hypothetical protein
MIDRIKSFYPKDMNDSRILISKDDIITDLPYAKGLHRAFDYHVNDTLRVDKIPANYVASSKAPSAVRVAYDYFSRHDGLPGVLEELMVGVGKQDLNWRAALNIGELMSEYDGVVQPDAGTFQVANKNVDHIVATLIERIGMQT